MSPEKRNPRMAGSGHNNRLGGRIDYAALTGRSQAGRIDVQTQKSLPANWRTRLPDAGRYYGAALGKLARADDKGWAACRCPFHEDARASASANLLTGGFRCHACEARGDLVGFHMRRTGLAFKAAVADLLRAAR
jgi:hypothetical protein